MKILFYIDMLSSGGAARMITLIANKLAERKYSVAIATNTERDIVYPIHENVEILSLYPQNAYKMGRIKRTYKLLSQARNVAKQYKPDVIVTTIPHISLFVKTATLGLRIPTIFCDVTSFARKDHALYHFIRYHFYHLADAITIETENDRRILGKRFPQKVVINDPLAFDVYHGPENREKFVLGIGPTREWDIKGFDMLLEAFGKIAHRYPEWKLKIAGPTDKDSLAFLYQIIDRLDIRNQVEFMGFQKDIVPIMRSASVFALASRIEGFSLSIIEAISQGCPCVCFQTVGVMTEVTENGTGALIAEDGNVEEYSQKLESLLEDDKLRKDLSKSGRSFVSKYETGRIVDQWESLFRKLLKM